METRAIRKFFRVVCKTPIYTQISIIKYNNKIVNTGRGSICVENMSYGGLMFLYALNLPVSDDMVIEFKLTINDEDAIFYGYIVRKEEIDVGVYRYGVNFIHENDDEEQFIRVLNELSKDAVLKNYSLPSAQTVDYVKKYNEKHNGRIYKRYKLNNKFVGKLKVNTLFNVSRINQWETILIDNISENGIRFISDIDMPVGEDIVLEFKIVIDNKEIYVKGYAIRKVKDEDNKYKYGVKLNIPKHQEGTIEKVLDQVTDLSVEKGLFTQKAFSLKFNYAKIDENDENDENNLDWWV